MDLQPFLKKLDQDTMKNLAQAESAMKLREVAIDLGYTLSELDAKSVFAALYPLRDAKISDDVIAEICGGISPDSTPFPKSYLYNKKTSNRF